MLKLGQMPLGLLQLLHDRPLEMIAGGGFGEFWSSMDETMFGIIDVGGFVDEEILKCLHNLAVGWFENMLSASPGRWIAFFLKDLWDQTRHLSEHEKGQVLNLPLVME